MESKSRIAHQAILDYPTRLLCPWGFSSQQYWSGLPCHPPRKLPNPGIEPRSSTLQVDSLWSEPPGKHKNTGELLHTPPPTSVDERSVAFGWGKFWLCGCPSRIHPWRDSAYALCSCQGRESRNQGISLSLLQGIFPTQELNWGLLRCRWILYQLSYPGNSQN